ncbi:hypothetical protein D2T29_12615 [Sinirhodobacter populi]|uniref:Uncharacterized protein n=1 Tax=Paenirhodobacter populi TaxID=2306993 RepID=A0A443KCH5_9RHOB|nr:hypothetical protein [Sinirhodobacter populi]RWR30507.1 hypothetical protein D2T29_12615 [Sinirhodobacter populi]
MTQDDEAGWQWWAGRTEDGMMTIGPCATREDAIAEAIADGFGEWLDESQDPPAWKNTFVVIEGRQDPLMLADWIDVERLLEFADAELANSNRVSSEFDYGPWFDAAPEQEVDLWKCIMTACDEWQKRHGLVFTCRKFSASRNAETVTTTALRAIGAQE